MAANAGDGAGTGAGCARFCCRDLDDEHIVDVVVVVAEPGVPGGVSIGVDLKQDGRCRRRGPRRTRGSAPRSGVDPEGRAWHRRRRGRGAWSHRVGRRSRRRHRRGGEVAGGIGPAVLATRRKGVRRPRSASSVSAAALSKRSPRRPAGCPVRGSPAGAAPVVRGEVRLRYADQLPECVQSPRPHPRARRRRRTPGRRRPRSRFRSSASEGTAPPSAPPSPLPVRGRVTAAVRAAIGAVVRTSRDCRRLLPEGPRGLGLSPGAIPIRSPPLRGWTSRCSMPTRRAGSWAVMARSIPGFVGSGRRGQTAGLDRMPCGCLPTMTSFVSHTSVDCTDAYALAEFWKGCSATPTILTSRTSRGGEECLILDPGIGAPDPVHRGARGQDREEPDPLRPSASGGSGAAG